MSHVETQERRADADEANAEASGNSRLWPAVLLWAGAVANILWVVLLGWLLARALGVSL